MENLYESAKNNPLFSGISSSDFSRLLNCVSAGTVKYNKNEIIMFSGEVVKYIGVILSGGVKIIKEDINGL